MNFNPNGESDATVDLENNRPLANMLERLLRPGRRWTGHDQQEGRWQDQGLASRDARCRGYGDPAIKT
jgi:hypothetical protein